MKIRIMIEDDELEFSAIPALMSKYPTMVKRGIVSMFFMSTNYGEGARLDIYQDNSWRCVSPILCASQDNEIASGKNATRQILIS